MPTVADLLEYLQGMKSDTIVVLDHMAAQQLPVDGDYMTCEVMLDAIQDQKES
jgi:hypothetical protein